MKGKTFSSWVLGIVAIAAVFYFAVTLNGAVGAVPIAAFATNSSTYTSSTTPSPPSKTPTVIHFASPSRLEIPSISVDAKVQHVGLTPKNTMGIPTNFTDVAWFKLGTIPGEKGSAVIDGHVDNGLALAGVFKHLGDTQVGNEIYIQDADGNKLLFVVTSVDVYDYKSTPDFIFKESEKKLLRLITCDGNWVAGEKTYDKRLVVTAEFVSSVLATSDSISDTLNTARP